MSHQILERNTAGLKRPAGVRKESEDNKMRQKLLSLIMIVIGLMSIPLCDMDGTFALMIVPMSIYLFFTRENWLA